MLLQKLKQLNSTFIDLVYMAILARYISTINFSYKFHTRHSVSIKKRHVLQNE